MNIDKFKSQHVDILGSIAALRKLTKAGVAANAAEIAKGIVAMSSTIKLHLATEDRALYPAIQRNAEPGLAQLGAQFQADMGPIAQVYEGFARRWSLAANLRNDEQGFRDDANRVLHALFERVQHENCELYPRVEAM